MNRLTRYTLWQLLIGTILVTASLTAVVWLAQSLRFVEMIINRGLSAGNFIYLVGLLLPNFLAIIIPLALFATVLFVYNKMSHDRELVVMRAAGLSQGDLARPALIMALICMAFLYALHLYAAPLSKRAFKDLRWEIRNGYTYIVLQEGQFNTFSDAVTVYVRERTKNGELLGILARDARDPKRPFTLMAERGALIRTDESTNIVMHNGNRQDINRTTNNLSILYFDKYTFDLGLEEGGGGPRVRDPGEMLTAELLNVEQNTNIAPHDLGKYKIQIHSRMTSPLYALTFTLIALAALISGEFTRRAATKRMIVAAVTVILVQLIAMGTQSMAAKNLALAPAVYAAALIPLFLAGYVVFYPPRRPSSTSSPSVTPTPRPTPR